MTVEFNVPVQLASKLSEGRRVEVSFPDLGLTLPGEVRFVSPVATAVVNTVRVTVMVPEAAKQGVPSGSKCVLANGFVVGDNQP